MGGGSTGLYESKGSQYHSRRPSLSGEDEAVSTPEDETMLGFSLIGCNTGPYLMVQIMMLVPL